MVRTIALCALAVLLSGAPPAAGQTLAETQDTVNFVISSAQVCSEYLQKPELLVEHTDRGRQMLTGAGMSADDAEAFMAEYIAQMKAKPMDEMQKQVACEMLNIPTIKVE